MEEESFLVTMGAYKIMGQDELAMKLIKSRMNGFKNVALLNYLAATICLESNDAETAITLLSNIKVEKLELAFPPVYYLTGKAKLFRLDPDAQVPMKQFLEASGGPDFQKASLYNLACFAYAEGRTNDYLNYLKQLKQKGRELTSRDIEAAWCAVVRRGEHHLPRRDVRQRAARRLCKIGRLQLPSQINRPGLRQEAQPLRTKPAGDEVRRLSGEGGGDFGWRRESAGHIACHPAKAGMCLG
jgi:hypothetical protein